MAISGLQVINVGLQNESTGSDSLYTAFNKTKTNFTTLFACASPYNTFTGNIGISVSSNANAGSVTITNTGVTNIIAGTGISVNQANGNVTISSTGGGNGGVGTVTSVGVQTVSSRITVSGSPIVSSGNITLDLATTGVSAGSYTYPSLTVDAYGRVTTISNGTSVGTVTSIAVSPGFGIQVTGSPVTTSGTITIQNTGVTRVSAGTGIALSGSNGNVTISTIPQSGIVTSVDIASNTLTITGSPITTAGTINIELPSTGNSTVGNLTVNGNLTVQGNITYINTEVLSVEDPIIQIGTGPNGAAPTSNSGKDIGTALNYYDSVAKVAWMGWDVSNAEISFGSNVSIASEVVTINTLANIRAGNTVISGTLNATGNANTGNLGTNIAVVTTGNITTINSGLVQNGTSNLTIAGSGNITLYVAGNATARAVFTSTGANIAGTANITGNLTAANLIGPLANGNSNVYVTAANGNITVAVAGTERIRADTAGNISLGATTGSESLRVQPTASSVNFLLAQGGAAGTGATITATGTDSNVNLRLGIKGSGQVQELVGSTYYALASQYDVGTAPNQIPLNQYLGTMAYQDSAAISTGIASLGIGNGSQALYVTTTASSVNYLQIVGAATGGSANISAQGSDTNTGILLAAKGTGNIAFTVGNVVVTGAGGLGYGTGSGGAQTQTTSRTQGVTLNKTNGAITLVSAAGTTAWQTFTVTNSTVAATDTVIVNQKSGTDLYEIHVTAVATGSFNITYRTTAGTTTEQPVFNFSVIKAATA